MNALRQIPLRSRRAATALAIIAAVLAVIRLFGALQKAETRPAINVMSFNIRYDNPGDGSNGWPNRKALVSSTLLFHQVDLAGLQEALRGQIGDLEGALPGQAWFGVGRDDGREAGEFNPVFFNTKKLKLLRQATFWLSETPDAPGNRSWDAACNRIVTWGEFEDLACGARFFFFNTHFDHVSETARRNSAALLLKKVDDIAGRSPVIVTGDFNSTARDAAYAVLTGGGPSSLADAGAISKTKLYGSSQSFNGFSSVLRPGHCIDFVFVRNVGAVLRHGIIAEKWDGRFASDHYPVLAEVAVK